MYIGLDVHKRNSYYSMIDDMGTEVRKDQFPTTREGLEEFANDLPEESKVAIEASTSSIFAYEYLDERGMHLAHPALVKPFARRHLKTDKVNSTVLAHLLRMDYLPESYVPKKEVRNLRTPILHSFIRFPSIFSERLCYNFSLLPRGVSPYE